MSSGPRNHQPSPFNPGYGHRPAVFGGHAPEIEELLAVFETLDFGENHSVLVSGLRGAGKTSMLSLLQDEARTRGWLVLADDASEGLMHRVMESTIPRCLSALDTPAKKRLTGLGLWRFSAEWEYQDRGRVAEPLLRHDLLGLAEALPGRGILITVDEVSSGKTKFSELSRFALEVQHALQAGANIMVVFAGIKVDLDLLLKQKHLTFLRRSRPLDFRRLSPWETHQVLVQTAAIGGRTIDKEAVDKLISVSQGYPYLIQLAGDYAWRHRPHAENISLEDAEHSFAKAIRAVQQRVLSRVYDDLSHRDKEFLQSMAVDGDKARILDVRTRLAQTNPGLDVSDQYVQVYKNRLIDSGYVQSAGRGLIEFSLPYLGQYIRSLLDGEDSDRMPEDDGWSHFPAPVM